MLRVLVVDGDLDTAHTLATLLHAMDYDVQFALSAKGALEIARRLQPHVVLLESLGEPDERAALVRALRTDGAYGAPRICRFAKPVDCGAVARLVQDAALGR